MSEQKKEFKVGDEEYRKAKAIVDKYIRERELCNSELYNALIVEFIEYLKQKNSCIIDIEITEKQEFRGLFYICPGENSPDMCEYYDGEYDGKLIELGKKYGISVAFVYWMYPK